MAEEDKKPEEKQAEKESKEGKQAQAPAEEKKETQAKKKKKINRLTLKELENKIKQVQQKMGGLTSAYAQQLLRRKEQLLQESKTEENLQGGGVSEDNAANR